MAKGNRETMELLAQEGPDVIVDYLIANTDDAEDLLKSEPIVEKLFESPQALVKLLKTLPPRLTKDLVNTPRSMETLVTHLSSLDISQIESALVGRLITNLDAKVEANTNVINFLSALKAQKNIFNTDGSFNEQAQSADIDEYSKFMAKLKDVTEPSLKTLCDKLNAQADKGRENFEKNYSEKRTALLVSIIADFPNKEIRAICENKSDSDQVKMQKLFDRYPGIEESDPKKFSTLLKKIFLDEVSVELLDTDTRQKQPFEKNMESKLGSFFSLGKHFGLESDIDKDNFQDLISAAGNYANVRVVREQEIAKEKAQSQILRGKISESTTMGAKPKKIGTYSDSHQKGSKNKFEYADAHAHTQLSIENLDEAQREAVMKEAVKKVHTNLVDHFETEPNVIKGSGATLILTTVSQTDRIQNGKKVREATLTTAALGDSTAYAVIRNKTTGNVESTKRLNEKLHSSSDPQLQEYCRKMGYPILVRGGEPRVGKKEAGVGRAFGVTVNKETMNPEPDVYHDNFSYDPDAQELLLIVCCDGLTEGVSGNHSPVDQMLLEYGVNSYNTSSKNSLAEHLMDLANTSIDGVKKGTTDDTTVMASNLSDSRNSELYCLCDGSGQFGDQVSQFAVSSMVSQCKQLTNSRERLNHYLGTESFLTEYERMAAILVATSMFDSENGAEDALKQFNDTVGEIADWLPIITAEENNQAKLRESLNNALDDIQSRLVDDPENILLQGLDTAIFKKLNELEKSKSHKSRSMKQLEVLDKTLKAESDRVKRTLKSTINKNGSIKSSAKELERLGDSLKTALNKLELYEKERCATALTVDQAKKTVDAELKSLSRTLKVRIGLGAIREKIYSVGSTLSIKSERKEHLKQRAAYVHEKRELMAKTRKSLSPMATQLLGKSRADKASSFAIRIISAEKIDQVREGIHQYAADNHLTLVEDQNSILVVDNDAVIKVSFKDDDVTVSVKCPHTQEEEETAYMAATMMVGKITDSHSHVETIQDNTLLKDVQQKIDLNQKGSSYEI